MLVWVADLGSKFDANRTFRDISEPLRGGISLQIRCAMSVWRRRLAFVVGILQSSQALLGVFKYIRTLMVKYAVHVDFSSQRTY